MAHKFDAAEFAARSTAKANLELSHVPPHAVPGVIERLDLVELMIGVVGE